MSQSIQGKSVGAIVNHQKSQLCYFAGNLMEQLPEAINLPKLIDKYLPRYRSRYFTPMVTMNLFLRQVLGGDRSCQHVVSQSSLNYSLLLRSTHSSNTAAYCKARQRLPLELIKSITINAGQWLNKNSHDNWKWLGRTIKLIDATTVSMPDTKENQRQYPQVSGQKEGIGFPLARISAIISLDCGVVLDAEIGDHHTSEQRLFLELSKTLSSGDVLVGDRLYCSYFVVAILQSLGVDCVFRMHASRKYNLKKGKKLGKDDHLTLWYKPQRPPWLSKAIYKTMPKYMLIRELAKKNITVVTTFLDKNEYPKNKIVNLYKMRWSIEIDFRLLKTIIKMDILVCKSTEMIQKEIWMNLLAYNLVRIMMAKSASINNLAPRNLSFTNSLQGVRLFLDIYLYVNEKEREILLDQLLINIASNRVGKRPGRREPRVVKRRPNPIAYMMKPRAELRKDLKNVRA